MKKKERERERIFVQTKLLVNRKRRVKWKENGTNDI